jgi:hypothetical protein
MQGYDESLRLFGHAALLEAWEVQMGAMVVDTQVAPAVAGLSLRRLHDARRWALPAVAVAFARQMSGNTPQQSGAFLEGFLSGGSEVMLHDRELLRMVDAWLCELPEEAFVESLPLLRRCLSGLDAVSRRRWMEQIRHMQSFVAGVQPPHNTEENAAFAAALPLLHRILGIDTEVAP